MKALQPILYEYWVFLYGTQFLSSDLMNKFLFALCHPSRKLLDSCTGEQDSHTTCPGTHRFLS